MEKNDKRITELKRELSREDESKIVEAIENLRKEKPFRGAVEVLAEVHSSSKSHDVRSGIEKFLNDLKDHSLARDIVMLIDLFPPGETRTSLIASCWQSGTDYSPYLDYFVKWSLSGDFKTVLECITVVEQWAPSLTQSERDACSDILGPEIKNPDTERGALLNELRLLLKG